MKRMLIDATHNEETRVAIIDGQRDGQQKLDDLDFEVANRKMLKGNIYLAKVIRIEPSLQAAFVEYGGNRHGFLAFSEIHPDYYRIPVGDRPDDEEEEHDAAEEITGPSEVDEAPDEDDDQPRANPWMDEPGSGGVGDLIPGFGAVEAHDSLIRDFGHSSVGEVGESSPVPTDAEPMMPPAENGETAPLPAPPDVVGGEEADRAPERFVRPRRPQYKIQEVIKRRQVMLIQVVKEERGNKGAALTTYLSLAGRYCVLMPNTERGGGVSRKITSQQDRRRMKDILDQLQVPDGMAVILRTAGMEQSIADIQHDMNSLMRLWDNIREQTLQSNAPALIYEEANLIKRSLRDLYSNEIAEILVAGERGYTLAHEFMKMIVPDAVDRIKLYDENGGTPLFFRYQVESQIDQLHEPTVQLRSGGSLVINPTEALVAIDVNSGRATRERHIEETALRTNLEAAEEIARQLRLRDLAGLVVIDFIDMEDGRNNAAVERKLKEAMRVDRARLQIGRISHFGLMELSRQRLRPSLLETNFEKCPHCAGSGYIRSVESAALSVLRALEEEGIRNRANDFLVHAVPNVCVYILNQKRAALATIEQRYGIRVTFRADEDLTQSEHRIERIKAMRAKGGAGPAVNSDEILGSIEVMASDPTVETGDSDDAAMAPVSEPRRDRFRDRSDRSDRGGDRGDRGGRNRGDRRPRRDQFADPAKTVNAPVLSNDANNEDEVNGNLDTSAPRPDDGNGDGDPRRRRRGRRGGRRRNRGEQRDDRDGQRPPRNNWGERETAPASGGFYADASAPVTTTATASSFAPVPRSVHDLDTTPRAEPRASSANDVGASSHETDAAPKTGWWRRLTGQ